MSPDQSTVLVVDDEPAVTDLYEHWLSEYVVYVANSGTEALSILDEQAEEIDVVLLDRKMPGMSGDSVLSEIRDEQFPCRVAIITAVNPDYDIIDMEFDDYVTKPVNKGVLCEVVEDLYARAEYADTLTRYYSLVAKHAALKSERPTDELEASEEFADLEAEIHELKQRLDEALELSDHREFQYVLREIA